MTSVVIRSHALIADLLTPDQMRRLAESEGLKGFMERLAETPYGDVTVEAGEVSMALERVFYRKLIERLTRIVGITPGNISRFLESYYYLRFEVLNLKRILRGKFSGMPAQQIIDSLVPIAPYRARNYEEMAKADALEAAVNLLGGTLYSPLLRSMELSRKYDALWPLELALNHIYASTILRAVEGLPYTDRSLVRWIVEFETDIENLLVAVKQRGAVEGVLSDRRLEDIFPTTYAIGLDKIKGVIEAKEIRSAIIGLDPPYSEILAPIYEGDVALIRSKLRQHTYQIARRGRSVNDYGFNVILAYLVFCEIEKDDLVGIAWGKTQGIPAEDILKYLVIPHTG
jgi:V/A-type H+-transporting ATPase subunit C